MASHFDLPVLRGSYSPRRMMLAAKEVTAELGTVECGRAGDLVAPGVSMYSIAAGPTALGFKPLMKHLPMQPSLV